MTDAITADGFKLNYHILGNQSANEAIIMAHGNGNRASDWQKLGYIEPLAKDYKLIVMDALGYGDSDKPYDAQYYTEQQRAQDVITVLQAASLNKAHFFGSSVGGSLGFVLAAKFPDYFLSFAIGAAHPYGSKQPIAANLFDGPFMDYMQQHGMQGFVEYLETEFLGKSFPETIRDDYMNNDVKALMAANSNPWQDYSSFLLSIKQPVWLFAGKKEPVVEFLPEISANIANCQTTIFPGFDHADLYWSGEVVASAYLDFLRGITT